MAGYLLDTGLVIRQRNVMLTVPDAIIAATALTCNLTLVTLNQTHFAGLSGLRLHPLPEA